MSWDNIGDAGKAYKVGDSFCINLEAIWHYGFAQIQQAMDWRNAVMFMEGDWDMVIKPLRNPGCYEVLPENGSQGCDEAADESTPAFAVSDGLRNFCVHGEQVVITEFCDDTFTVQPLGKPQFEFAMSPREMYWGTRPL